MNKKFLFLLLVVTLAISACQSIGSSRSGAVIAACSELVLNVSRLQPAETPEYLLTTGEKRGDEFDVNHYFSAFTHLSMRDGYELDYVYQKETLGGYPLLYPRPTDQPPFMSTAELPDVTEWPDYREYMDVEDTEQGYFEYVLMDIMANQFYLFWHANYNDTLIVCNRRQLGDIVTQVSSGEFGNPMDAEQQQKARTLRNILPIVRLEGDTAVVEVVTFTKWGGFYRLTYTISRETPHRIIDIQRESILPYDCGVMF